MKNPNRSASIQKTEKTDNRNVFNEWYNKTILKTVTEGMQLVHKIINEEFSTKPINLEKSRCILDNTIEKLVAVEKFTRLSCDSRCDDDLPF
ncbi:MAG: hypothetical protein HN716_02635 [Candidatus Marinimicrobia bacterium]|nr:hypothetical protein [Candidatus Neomarinimicrobiota bacterium]MBT6797336.1 hypothetical protein [Candidatus Neomarinimicrobiota bacterium]MBT7944999.1 hypothetical protein [Candidatus Neomarinimicrobiota bacterium]